MARSIVDRWWEYMRRDTDELGYKTPRWDLGHLDEGEIQQVMDHELTDEDVSDIVVMHGFEFKPEITRRTTFSSEIFQINSYITLALIDLVHQSPTRLGKVEAVKPVEEIERSWRRLGAVSPIWCFHNFNAYFVGRELLLQLGLRAPEDGLDDARLMVDFYRRGRLARRNDGALSPKDTNDEDPYLPSEVVAGLADQSAPMSAAEHKALRRLSVTLASYCFLYMCDSRMSQHDSGPYRISDDRSMIVRGYFSLGPARFPWSTELSPPATAYSFGLLYDPSEFTDIQIIQFFTLFSEPEQFMTMVKEAVVIEHGNDGVDRVVPPEEWGDITQQISREHLKLYERIVAMDTDERLIASTKVYGWDPLFYAEDAGVADDIVWELHPKTMELYDQLRDDEFAGQLFARACITNGINGGFTPMLDTDYSRRVEIPRERWPVLNIGSGDAAR
jgi:hypothetical protein